MSRSPPKQPKGNTDVRLIATVNDGALVNERRDEQHVHPHGFTYLKARAMIGGTHDDDRVLQPLRPIRQTGAVRAGQLGTARRTTSPPCQPISVNNTGPPRMNFTSSPPPLMRSCDRSADGYSIGSGCELCTNRRPSTSVLIPSALSQRLHATVVMAARVSARLQLVPRVPPGPSCSR